MISVIRVITINNIRYALGRICLIVSDYLYTSMCLVLFVVSEIHDSSELLSRLLEMDVEYFLVCIKYDISNCEYM